MKRVTAYFRNAVVCSTQSNIIYKNSKFYTISSNELEEGALEKTVVQDVFKGKRKDTLNMVIALKTIATKFTDASVDEEDIEEMTSVLFLPVKAYATGTLSIAEDGKLPWIPRNFLEPMIENELAIGTIDDYDKFLETTTDERNQIDTWKKYLEYAKKLFRYVTGNDFKEDVITYAGKSIKTDGKFYVFEDDTVYSVAHILELYNHLLREDKEHPLYDRLTNGQTEVTKPRISNWDVTAMIEHAGQMNGEFPLSQSQREAMNHYNEIICSEILAVNGPPGTGKTTLLQSVVADTYVKCALEGKEAPIIVATSTNNQAVTNIIDSFGKTNSIGIRNLEQRWIEGVNSFAVYFPSAGKEKEAKGKGYQYTNVRGENFAETVEGDKNREKSKVRFIKEMSDCFCLDIREEDLNDCMLLLSERLNLLDDEREECICLAEEIMDFLDERSFSEYESNFLIEIDALAEEEHQYVQRIQSLTKENKGFLKRIDDWKESYRALPWCIRLFSFIPRCKKEIILWSYKFMQENEMGFLNRGMVLNEIESIYLHKIDENDLEIQKLEANRQKIIFKIEEKKREHNEILNMINELQSYMNKFEEYQVEEYVFDRQKRFDISSFNEILDRVRYVEFWLAVHYYECRWILEENPITEKQKGKTYENILDMLYHRIAMLSPCFVMTCFMLPKQFKAYTNDRTHQYMYNYIDLLIVDEAGQISPEIGSAVFSLAKKAIVVGDEKQIPPVWNTARALDITMAIDKNMIRHKDEFGMLERNGLNCSESSIMRIASLSCPYDKDNEKGLFLSEHRRCYNEIIEYCNKLVYQGRLQPLRGYASEDMKFALQGILSSMGHYHIEVEHSQRIGTSRKNEREAEAIVNWIKTNYIFLREKYLAAVGGVNFNPEEILGIITPFKGQKGLIACKLKNTFPEYAHEISVGTVHTFQGAERRIIIFSSVYGSEDGCYFINHNDSLMNVAVSRAKDAFLVFGDRRCLTGGVRSAAALLKRFTESEVRTVLQG